MTANPLRAIVAQIAELACKLQQQVASDDIDTTLHALLSTAVDCVPGAEHAAIAMNRHREVQTVMATGGCPAALEGIRRRHKGMWQRADRQDQVLCIDDVTVERRWPRYCRDVADETSIRSIMTIPLFTDRRRAGVLSFYAERPYAFDAKSAELGLITATHIAVAWTMLRHDQQFHTALASRDLIGQAKGIVMERFKVDGERAFALLSRLSQNSNTPIVEIARRLVHNEHPLMPHGALASVAR